MSNSGCLPLPRSCDQHQFTGRWQCELCVAVVSLHASASYSLYAHTLRLDLLVVIQCAATVAVLARSNATSHGVEELVLEIPNPGTLVMELTEVLGVGDYESYALWGVQDPGATFKFESGTTDVGLVLLHDAVVDAFASTGKAAAPLKLDDAAATARTDTSSSIGRAQVTTVTQQVDTSRL